MPRFTVNIDGRTEEVDLPEKISMIDEMIDLNSTDISKISTNDAELDSKANLEDLEALSSLVDTKLDSKANIDDLATLFANVDTKLDLKPNLDDLAALSSDVDTKLGGKVDTNHLTTNYQLGSDTLNSLNTKADISMLDSYVLTSVINVSLETIHTNLGVVYTKVETDARETSAKSETAEKLDAKAVVINNSLGFKADRTDMDNYTTTTDINNSLGF